MNTPRTQPILAAPDRHNNFNFLRLLFAMMVLSSHSFELVDGDRHREILTRFFGTMSLGEVAVFGFFLLSGYLIVQSWQLDPNFFNFIKKRVLRIFPGFCVAFLFSVLIVGPLGSKPEFYFVQLNWPNLLRDLLLLRCPDVPPVFQGQPYDLLNSSMWTIEYEFRCYLVVALIGFSLLSLQRRGKSILFSVACLIFLGFLSAFESGKTIIYSIFKIFIADSVALTNFLLFFCVGGYFYLFREKIVYKSLWSLAAMLILVACLFQSNAAFFALITSGAYLIFWFALNKFSWIERFQLYPDVSYGAYLYGWPVQKLLLWYIPRLAPLRLFLASCLLSCLCGLVSWHCVERPFLRFKPKPFGQSLASKV